MAGLICLIGPPAVGKSTIAQALGDQFGVEVFRLRAAVWKAQARRLRMNQWCSSTLRHWTTDRAAGHCLRKAFVDDWTRRRGTVVLDNLPHSQIQTGQVHLIAARRKLPLVIVELTAAEQVLYRRAAARRVCPGCDPDPYGDPYYPAGHPAPADPSPASLRPPRLTPLPLGTRQAPVARREALGVPVSAGLTCPRCGAYLIARRVDSAAILNLRLIRYHSRIESIRRAAIARGRSLATVDATSQIDDCLARIQASVGDLLPHRSR